MDFMFEDEVDEVGSDVEAYCPKCKADTTHVVISKYEDEIRRVQCNPCGDVHSFRKPRGEAEEDIPEPMAANKRALLKKPTWEEFFAKHGEGMRSHTNFAIPTTKTQSSLTPSLARVRVGSGFGEQGGNYLQGRAAGSRAQPKGHARIAGWPRR